MIKVEVNEIADFIIGIATGSFDILHPGYIDMFEFAKNNCDYLIIALHIDPSVERPDKLKPILSVVERKKALLSIRFIDEVILYNTEMELESILTRNKIDVRFLGDDYIGKEFTSDHFSIPIVYVSRDHGWSSTKLKNMISEEITLGHKNKSI